LELGAVDHLPAVPGLGDEAGTRIAGAWPERIVVAEVVVHGVIQPSGLCG
jgi:hypothetical protein